jgi:hypothetical protein
MWSLREIGDPGPRPVERLLAAMDAETALGLVDRHGAALLVPDERTHGALRAGPRALADVDAARFDATIRPLLGDATLSYRSDATAVTAMVGVGDADAVILLRPVSVAQIRGAADARVLMPEKTTYFAPKPRTGMVMRALDAG